MSTAPIPDDVTGPERTIRQMNDLFFAPEIARRQAAGLLPTPFDLQKAQVLFAEGIAPIIRLNDEVTISLIVRASTAVQPGDQISESEITNIEGFELELADRDAGHFTILALQGGLGMFFDFRRNKGKAADLVKRAHEFLSTADHAFSEKRLGPYLDNLFSACELAAKARLITIAQESRSLKGHRVIHSQINQWGRLGNVDREFVKTFNKLARAREAARYSTEDLSDLARGEYLEIARNEISELMTRLKRFDE